MGMAEKLAVGTAESSRIVVDKDRTIGFMGEDCRVYSTPSLVHDIEHTCRDLIKARVPEGQDSVGFKVSVTHMAPTLMGMEVEITATITESDGRRIVFEIEASDPVETICKARHERFVVDVEKTKQRLLAKAARASSETGA
jgi:fluoroacetyl-CoA thioesterase